MRFIDAEALKESIYKEKIQYTQPFIQASLILLEKLIKNAPTIEAKPVVHAHWEWAEGYKNEVGFCSNCKADYFNDGINNIKQPYCYNCGAQMDEVASDTNVGSKKEKNK